MGDARHADFGVTHRCRVIAIHGTKVTLAIDQHITQGKVLGHAHDGVVHSGVAMRVVFTDHIADNPGGFFIRTIPVVRELMHGEENPAVHRLQAVTHIG